MLRFIINYSIAYSSILLKFNCDIFTFQIKRVYNNLIYNDLKVSPAYKATAKGAMYASLATVKVSGFVAKRVGNLSKGVSNYLAKKVGRKYIIVLHIGLVQAVR